MVLYRFGLFSSNKMEVVLVVLPLVCIAIISSLHIAAWIGSVLFIFVQAV